jgi:uncharacterized protein YyaL (SSP411 family)
MGRASLKIALMNAVLIVLLGSAEAAPEALTGVHAAGHETIPGEQASEVLGASEVLRASAISFGRTGGPEYLVSGREQLRRLAGLLIAGPDLATRDAAVAISALCVWADATGDAVPVSVAIATAEWALSDRGRDDGGYGSARGGAPPALLDSVAMGHALLALYETTGDPAWLARAQETAGFIGARFLGGGPGFSSVSSLDQERRVLRGENLDTVRFVAWLGHVTGEPRWSGMARHGLAWLGSSPDLDGATAAAFRAVDEPPVHLVVVGPYRDPGTQALYDAARALPLPTRWLEWRDPQVWVATLSAAAVPLQGPPSVYWCQGVECGDPMRSVGEIHGLLDMLVESPVAQGDHAELRAP